MRKLVKTFAFCRPSAAFGLGLLLLTESCSSSCRRAEPNPADFDSLISEEPNLAESPLSGLFFDGCAAKNPSEVPILYAHFLNSSASSELSLKDLTRRDISSFACAPGPYLASEQEKSGWELERMPAYFVWPTGNNGPEQEQFYLTNQSGLPIKSTTVTMGSGKNRTVVLYPQTQWNKGESYYLYQVLIQGESRTTWVQPIKASS